MNNFFIARNLYYAYTGSNDSLRFDPDMRILVITGNKPLVKRCCKMKELKGCNYWVNEYLIAVKSICNEDHVIITRPGLNLLNGTTIKDISAVYGDIAWMDVDLDGARVVLKPFKNYEDYQSDIIEAS